MADLQEFISSVDGYRKEIVVRLLDFSATDTILYVRECISDEKRLRCLDSAIQLANTFLQTKYEEIFELEVSGVNLAQREKLKVFLDKLDNASLVVLFLVVTELKSVLLGVVFLYHAFSVQDIFNLAFAEELEEQNIWGKDEFITQRYSEIFDKLISWEKFCDERSLFKN